MEVWVAVSESMKIQTPQAYIKAMCVEVKKSSAVMRPLDKDLFSTIQIEVDIKNIFPSNKSSQEGFDDMVNMDNLNEAELLYNIQRRFEKDNIFTYVGPTLLAVNPFKVIPELFSEEILLKYQKKSQDQSFDLNTYFPHIFAIAAKSYKQVSETRKKQAIVISGESGAGKTEEAKYAMKFLTTMGRNIVVTQDHIKQLFTTQTRKNSLYRSESISQSIEEKILSCNPILEAFGNAKTVRNDNSSRFGKLVLLMLNKQNLEIKGAVQTNYLLEKSRLIEQTNGERNYHIFYHLFKGAPKNLLEALSLDDMKKFSYLNKTDCFSIANMNDAEKYEEIQNSFKTMGFDDKEQVAIWNIVGAILHLGNCDFDEKTLDNNNPCSIINQNEFLTTCKLLQCDPEGLKSGLVNKSRVIGNQTILGRMNKIDCLSARDSFTKALYEHLFVWLIRRLNYAIAAEEFKFTRFDDIIKDANRLSIGLLDIFGFEVFKNNSFEQFCINFANEKLQQLYIKYVFKAEKAEFINEGLKDILPDLDFQDNQPIIDLMELYPLGLFNLLDESSGVASTDEALIQNMIKNHKANKSFKASKSSKFGFVINHTACEVEYNIQGFRIKNKDELPQSLINLMADVKNSEISDIFQMQVLQLKGKVNLDDAAEDSNNSKGKKVVKFLGSKFRQQMKDLMAELDSSDCHFVRCIKPNELKQMDLFVPNMALNQIRYLGVLDSIRIRKESYPIRKTYSKFYEAYYELDPNSNKSTYEQMIEKQLDLQELSKGIVKSALPNEGPKTILFGVTKVFMRSEVLVKLDNIYAEKVNENILSPPEIFKNEDILLNKLNIFKKIKIKIEMAKKIQRKYFQYTQMKKLRFFLKGLRRIQKLVRARIDRKRYLKTKAKIIRIQKFCKNYLARKNLAKSIRKLRLMCQATTKITAIRKMVVARRLLIKTKRAVKVIERNVKSFLAKARLRNRKNIRKLIYEVIIDGAWNTFWNTKVVSSAVRIQKVFRGYKCRKLHRNVVVRAHEAKMKVVTRKSATLIQKTFRGFVVRRELRKQHEAAYKIQGYFRMKILSNILKQIRKSTRIIQKFVRRKFITKKILREKWQMFYEKEMLNFDHLRNIERETLFGGKDITRRIINSANKERNSFFTEEDDYFSSSKFENDNFLMTSFTGDGFEYERNTKYQTPKREYFLNRFEENQFFEGLLSYSSKQKKSESEKKVSGAFPITPKRPEIETDLDKSRKIRLYPLIIDVDFVCDTCEMYKPLWSSLYNLTRQDALEADSQIQTIEVGEAFTLVSTDAGKIYSWGLNDFSQLGRNTEEENDRCSIGQVKLPNFESVLPLKLVVGDSHSFIVDINGRVFSWGDNFLGQLGVGNTKIQHKVVQSDALPKGQIKDIASKGSYNIAVTNDGKVLFWPFQKSDGHYIAKPLEMPIPAGVQISSVSCGNNFVILLAKNGLVYSFGKESCRGQLGLGDKKQRNVPSLVPLFKQLGEKVAQISCGFKHTICKTHLGKVFTWGAGDSGQLGFEECSDQFIPKILEIAYISSHKNSNAVLHIAAGLRSSAVLTSNRKVYWWGTNSLLNCERRPKKMDFSIMLNLGDSEKESLQIPVKLLSSWSRSMSIFYLTMADCSSVTATIPLLRKVCQTLSLKWEEKSIEPPYVESVSRHFTFKSLKKMAILSPKHSRIIKSPTEKESHHSPIKLSKTEKESLLQLCKYMENSSPPKLTDTSLSRNLTPTKKSMSPFRIDKFSNEFIDKKLRALKQKIINLIKTPREIWTYNEMELMKFLCDPDIYALIKKI